MMVGTGNACCFLLWTHQARISPEYWELNCGSLSWQQCVLADPMLFGSGGQQHDKLKG